MNLRTNPELLPLIEWWEKDGKETVIYLLVAAIAVGAAVTSVCFRALARSVSSPWPNAIIWL